MKSNTSKVERISSHMEHMTLKKKLQLLSALLGLFHAFICAFSFLAEVPALGIYNICSVFFYLVIALSLVRKEYFGATIILTILESLVCSFFSTLCTGFDTGYSAYNIAVISASFYFFFMIDSFKKKLGIPFFISLLSGICYIFNYFIMIFTKPLFPHVTPFWTHLIFIVNYLVVFVLVSVFSILLIIEINISNAKLTEQNKLLNDLAQIDPLTTLVNRRSMSGHLEQSMDSLRTKGIRFSLILGDIDDFKKINDTYGHEAGDFALQRVASIIRDCIRDEDVACRWGGEEFLILIKGSAESANMIAERIRHSIADTAIEFNDTTIRFTMTMGISESIPGYRIEHFIKLADDKLYEGKQNGKNQVVI